MPDAPKAAELLFSIESIGEDSRLSVDEARLILTDIEIARAEAFKFDIHRNRYVRGRALLRSLAGNLLDIPPSTVTIDTEERGKPFIPNSNLAFNLSHSGDAAAFAFSTELDRIGVDIESINRRVDVNGLSEHYFTPGEQTALAALEKKERKRLFFHIWTAKEARMKLTGEGLHLDPRRIDVTFKDGKPFGYRRPAPLSLPLWSHEYQDLNAIVSITADRPFDRRSLPNSLT